MENQSYVTFTILGIKHHEGGCSFRFNQDTVCEISNDRFIERVRVNADISSVTFYLKETLEITEDVISQIVEYLYSYLGSMMISLIKNSSEYSDVSLRPRIHVSDIRYVEAGKVFEKNKDCIGLTYSLVSSTFSVNGDDVLRKWIHDVDVFGYTEKEDKYDILFMLLQIKDKIQKYMALYAYLMRLVKEISFTSYESQKQVVQYISEKCSKIGIVLKQSQTTRPGAQPTDRDDQFTMLRNKIAHPAVADEVANVSEIMLNNLAAIICCAIEDLPAKSN